MPYYLKYNPQDNFYFASENSNFRVNPYRSEGTYTKYVSLDDKLDNLHFYTWFIKTGRGRATEDAALEVRNGIITRDEAIALVKKYDGEFPKNILMKYLIISILMKKNLMKQLINLDLNIFGKIKRLMGTKACCLDESKK